MVRPAGLPGAITHAVFPTSKHAPRAATCCGHLPPTEWALKAPNTRDALEYTAVQLVTPNSPEAADCEAEGERGQDFEEIITAKLIGLSHFEPPWHLRVTQSFLTVAITVVGRTKESKWRALNFTAS
jgi:hypothetical protein